MEEQATDPANDEMKSTFDRTEALRRVWLMMNRPQYKRVKKPEAKTGGGSAAKARQRGKKAEGRQGRYPRVRKYPENPAVEGQPVQPLHKHFSETEEERSERLAGYVERYRRATQNESAEERQKRLERLEEEKKQRMAMPYKGRVRTNRYENETEEQRQKRLAKYARNNRRKLDNETVEKRERRLEFAKICAKRSLEQKRLLKKLKIEKEESDPAADAAPAPDTVTPAAEDLAKGVRDSQKHLEFAKRVAERRRIVAEAVDKEHLEEMVAFAQESLLPKVKREPPESGETSAADRQESTSRMPWPKIKMEKPDYVEFGEKSTETSPEVDRQESTSRTPRPKIKMEKPDYVEFGEKSTETSPEVDRQETASRTPWPRIKIEKPDYVEFGDVSTVGGPRASVEVPTLQIKTEEQNSAAIAENSSEISTNPKTTPKLISSWKVQPQTQNCVLIGENSLATSVGFGDALTVGGQASVEMPSLHIKTEKPNPAAIADNSSEILANPRTTPEGTSLLKAQAKTQNCALIGDNSFTTSVKFGDALTVGGPRASVGETPYLQIKTERQNPESSSEILTTPRPTPTLISLLNARTATQNYVLSNPPNGTAELRVTLEKPAPPSNLPSTVNRIPVLHIKTETRDNAAFLQNSTVVGPPAAVDETPSPQTKTEKPNPAEVAETSLKILDNPLTTTEVTSLLRVQTNQPNHALTGANLLESTPVLRVKTEKPNHVCMGENAPLCVSQPKFVSAAPQMLLVNNPPAVATGPLFLPPGYILFKDNLPKTAPVLFGNPPSTAIGATSVLHAPVQQNLLNVILAPVNGLQVFSPATPLLQIKLDHGFVGGNFPVSSSAFMQPPLAIEMPTQRVAVRAPDLVMTEGSAEEIILRSLSDPPSAGGPPPPGCNGTAPTIDRFTYEDFDVMLESAIDKATSVVLGSLNS